MSIDILMPALSPTMEEGILAKWLIKEGDKHMKKALLPSLICTVIYLNDTYLLQKIIILKMGKVINIILLMVFLILKIKLLKQVQQKYF